MQLIEEIEVTLIHGTTGTQVSDQVLEAGLEIKALEEDPSGVVTKWTFLAKAPDSDSWFKYQSYSMPVVR